MVNMVSKKHLRIALLPEWTPSLAIGLMVLMGPLGSSGCGRAARPQAAAAVQPHALSPQQVHDQLLAAVKDQPDDPALRVELATLELRSNDPASAEATLRECWHRFPRYARGPYQLGLLLLLTGRDADSVAPLKAAASLAPTDALTLGHTALACYRAGLIADSKRYVAAALHVDGRYAEPYLLLAHIYDQHGTAQSAMEYVRRYLAYSPSPGPGYYMMGRLYSRQASRDGAEQWLQRAVDAEPANPEYWTALGRVYCELFGAGRAPEGIECYRRALAIDPSNAGANQYLGQALLNERRFADAADHLRTAIEHTHEPGPLYYLLGQALLKGGREPDGRAALAKYRDFQDYTSRMTRLTHGIDARSSDRKLYYDLIRLCLRYHQYRAAKNALKNAASHMAADETLRRLGDELQTRIASAVGIPAQPGTGGAAPGVIPPGGVHER